MEVAYGPYEARTYEQNRRSNVADMLFWKMEEQELLNAICKTKSGIRKNILEAGCGTGRLLTSLKKKTYSIYGVDISPYMLAIAHRKYKGKFLNAHLIRADIAHLPFRDSSFDFIFCIRVINQLPSKTYAFDSIRELCRVCKKSGVMLVEFVNSWGLSRLSLKRCTYLSLSDIKKILSERGHSIYYVHGVLFFSQSIWRMLPTSILLIFAKLDLKICRFLPMFSTRIYICSSKEGSDK
jgi:ubiquinone/menaquinone biosynthesis C-methylase UbiE